MVDLGWCLSFDSIGPILPGIAPRKRIRIHGSGQLVVNGSQLLALGVMDEYLWRTLDETKRRPRFIVDRIVSLQDDPAT